MLASTPLMRVPSPSQAGSGPPPAAVARAGKGPPFRQIILPDLAVIEPMGISPAQVTGLGRLAGVRNVLALDGAAIRVHGRRVNVVGVNAQQFRSWTPLHTASDERLWGVLEAGGFVSSHPASHLLRLRPGGQYRLSGLSEVSLVYGGAATLGIAGVDLVVSSRESAPLGLIHNVAALLSAPGVKISKLRREVRAMLGTGGTLVSLRQPRVPVNGATSPGRPGNYLELFQASAARYCPGMPWTVLAAIGQIESGDGSNNGPSRAGALGPMQFLPSTWAVWGISAFGEPGPPNIMDPYDAVPSAARLLCAAGGGTTAGLPGAIFAYNHANWYVAEVLALAGQYAQAYG